MPWAGFCAVYLLCLLAHCHVPALSPLFVLRVSVLGPPVRQISPSEHSVIPNSDIEQVFFDEPTSPYDTQVARLKHEIQDAKRNSDNSGSFRSEIQRWLSWCQTHQASLAEHRRRVREVHAN